MSHQTPEPEDLRRLQTRLDEVRRREAAKNPQSAPTPMGVAFRFGTEMIAGIAVGGALGWGIDWLAGTRPVFLIVMFVLGAAAGVLNVMRAAKEMTEQAAKAAKGAPSVPDSEDEE